ncbi:hypothetical protein POTOM_024051 [Populus tomentosa]|uniref:Uncharacterized protein n=2 Tax=Populus TaxID=3689 RepID=A0A8X7ZML9_POPTO|nr:hypothetical protein POTOM_024051 [Populus tomentosa]
MILIDSMPASITAKEQTVGVPKRADHVVNQLIRLRDISIYSCLKGVAVGNVLRMPSEVSRFFRPGEASDDYRDDDSTGIGCAVLVAGSNGNRNRHQVIIDL